jgi:hypothetical protein
MTRPILACLLLAIATSSAPAQQKPRAVRTAEVGTEITPEVERAVEQGQRWLAERQHATGCWIQDIGFKLNSDYKVTSYEVPHIGVTALALMSFLAAGHLPGRGKYGDVLDRGLDYLLGCVRENGYIVDHETRMYSHALATLFLAEIYGMTRRNDVRTALQKAVNLICDSQNAQGGWRYKPFSPESDMSITVCQVVALRAARNKGITVPRRHILAAESYVRKSAVDSGTTRQRPGRSGPFYINEGGAFRYQLGPNGRTTFPLTAAGVTTLFAAGNYDEDLINNALDYMDHQLDSFNNRYDNHYFFYYGHYYAVQAYYIAGNERWRHYYSKMTDKLLSMQRRDGSWPCEIGPGDVFGTAVATLVLSIPYQYLPIFQR